MRIRSLAAATAAILALSAAAPSGAQVDGAEPLDAELLVRTLVEVDTQALELGDNVRISARFGSETDAVTGTVGVIELPASLELVPGSAEFVPTVSAVGPTDPTQITVDGNLVTFRVGVGADATQGGSFGVGEGMPGVVEAVWRGGDGPQLITSRVTGLVNGESVEVTDTFTLNGEPAAAPEPPPEPEPTPDPEPLPAPDPEVPGPTPGQIRIEAYEAAAGDDLSTAAQLDTGTLGYECRDASGNTARLTTVVGQFDFSPGSSFVACDLLFVPPPGMVRTQAVPGAAGGTPTADLYRINGVTVPGPQDPGVTYRFAATEATLDELSQLRVSINRPSPSLAEFVVENIGLARASDVELRFRAAGPAVQVGDASQGEVDFTDWSLGVLEPGARATLPVTIDVAALTPDTRPLEMEVRFVSSPVPADQPASELTATLDLAQAAPAPSPTPTPTPAPQPAPTTPAPQPTPTQAPLAAESGEEALADTGESGLRPVLALVLMAAGFAAIGLRRRQA